MRTATAIVLVLTGFTTVWAQPANPPTDPLAYAAPGAVMKNALITEQLLIGDHYNQSLSLRMFEEVLRVVGIKDVSNGTGTMRPLVIDADGDFKKDGNATVSTSGGWTLGATLAVSGNTTITGNLIGGTGNLLVTSPAHFSGSTVGLAALGASNVRVGVNSTSPRVILEDAGFPQWEVDNVDGLFRLVRMNSSGTVDNRPLQIDGNINVQPFGKRILPVDPYGVDLGSQQYKFGALWTGDLYADRLVTIENIGTIDNRWLIGSGNLLDADLSQSGTTMIARYNNYVSGTFIYLQKFGKTEFIKTTSGPTLTNKITNGSFETGTTAWTGTSATLSTSTAKTFHGEWSMLIDATAGSNTFASFGGFTFTTGTDYTFCFVARRVDGAAMANGAVAVLIRDTGNTFVDLNPQATQTDAWSRFCRTATAGASATATVPVIDTKGVDIYVDSIQIEETTVERPYSEYRASYTISRNEDAGSGNQWYAGDGMFSVGANTGDGWIDCYAIRGIKSATEQGPACVVNVRTGSSFNSWAPRAAWGNLDGIYGYSGTTYGFAAGNGSATHIKLDDVNGFRIMNGSTVLTQFDISGNGFLKNNLTIDASGSLRSGASAYDTDTGYWLDYNGGSPRFRIGTDTGESTPRYLRWTGSALEVMSDPVSINANGIVITGYTGSTWSDAHAYKFDFGDGRTNGLATYTNGAFRVHELRTSRAGAAGLILIAENTSGGDAEIVMSSANGGTTSRIDLNSTRLFVNSSQGYTGTCANGTYSNGILISCP